MKGMNRRHLPIHYVGLLRSPASWAKIGRNLLDALKDLGYCINASEYREDRYEPDFKLPIRVEQLLGSREKKSVGMLGFLVTIRIFYSGHLHDISETRH